MTFPILEFDSTPEAFIEPSKIMQARDLPEHCVISFFKEVIDRVIEKQDAKIVVENRWEDGPHSIYEISHRGQRLAFFHPGVGAPIAAGLLEEAIAFGCRKFIACGGCGVLEPEIAVGHVIVVTEAVRDEGVSYHYLPPGREVSADERGVHALVKELDERGVPYRLGKTWTTDAPYRETVKKIARRRDERGIHRRGSVPGRHFRAGSVRWRRPEWHGMGSPRMAVAQGDPRKPLLALRGCLPDSIGLLFS
jgi:hypothetical protein